MIDRNKQNAQERAIGFMQQLIGIKNWSPTPKINLCRALPRNALLHGKLSSLEEILQFLESDNPMAEYNKQCGGRRTLKDLKNKGITANP